MALFRCRSLDASADQSGGGSTEFEGGLWRIWDGGQVVGWLSTSDGPAGWVEIEIQFAEVDWWLQHCDRKVEPLGSGFLNDVASRRLTTDRLGAEREFTTTWVSDDEFERIASTYYGFY